MKSSFASLIVALGLGAVAPAQEKKAFEFPGPLKAVKCDADLFGDGFRLTQIDETPGGFYMLTFRLVATRDYSRKEIEEFVRTHRVSFLRPDDIAKDGVIVHKEKLFLPQKLDEDEGIEKNQEVRIGMSISGDLPRGTFVAVNKVRLSLVPAR